MQIISSIYKFVLQPEKTVKFPNKITFKVISKEFWRFVVFDILSIIVWAVFVTILYILFDDFKMLFDSKINSNNSLGWKLIFFACIAPIIEEVSFRLALNPSKFNLSISLAFQTVLYLHLLYLIDVNFYIRLLIMLVLGLFLNIYMPQKIENFINKNLRLFIYYNIIFFGLIHTSNFDFTSVSQIYFIPFLILIQLLLGIYFSYMRLKYNFLIVLGFHIFHNFIFISLGSFI